MFNMEVNVEKVYVKPRTIKVRYVLKINRYTTGFSKFYSYKNLVNETGKIAAEIHSEITGKLEEARKIFGAEKVALDEESWLGWARDEFHEEEEDC